MQQFLGRFLPVLVAGVLGCNLCSADVLRKVDTQGKDATSGILVGDTFYFAGHALSPKTKGEAEQSSQRPTDSIAGLFSPGSLKKIVVGDTGRIYALKQIDGFLLAATEKGLFKTEIHGDSSLGESWGLISISEKPFDTLAVVSNLICVGTGPPLVLSGAKAGYDCYNIDGTAAGPSGEESPTVLQSFGENLLVGGNGFFKIHDAAGDFVKKHMLPVDPEGRVRLIGGIRGVGDSVWIWTTEPKGVPGPLLRVRIGRGTVGDLETFPEKTLQAKGVTVVSEVNAKPWFGTWKGEIFRLTEDQELVPVDMAGQTFPKAISGIEQLRSGSVWIGTTEGSFMLEQSSDLNGAVRKSPKPLLAMKKENEKIDVSSITEGQTLWLWGKSGVYEFDSNLSLSFETNSHRFLDWLSWLLDAPLRVTWGSDLKVDFDKAFYYRDGAKEEGTRFAALPLEVTSDPRSIELAAAGRSTPDDYAWAKIRHFNHDLNSFWPRKVDLVMKDSFGNLSEMRARRYLPIFTAIQVVPLYFLFRIVLSALGNLLLLFASNKDLARRFLLRESGKLIVFNPNWVLIPWVRRRLLDRYRSRLREHLKSKKGNETFSVDASLVSGLLRRKEAALAHSTDPSLLMTAARSYRLHLLNDDPEDKPEDKPLMTPVEVNLQTAVKNEVAFQESAKTELHEFGSFYHSGIREHILNGPDMVLCITGITSDHLKQPKTDCESGNSKVYWALKHLFETYGASHGILIFCQGKPESFDSLGVTLKPFDLDSPTSSTPPAKPEEP